VRRTCSASISNQILIALAASLRFSSLQIKPWINNILLKKYQVSSPALLGARLHRANKAKSSSRSLWSARGALGPNAGA
jgi:hypothetical protein